MESNIVKNKRKSRKKTKAESSSPLATSNKAQLNLNII